MVSVQTQAFLDKEKGVVAKKNTYYVGPFDVKNADADDVASALSKKYGPFGDGKAGLVSILKAVNGIFVVIAYNGERAFSQEQKIAMESAIAKVVKA